MHTFEDHTSPVTGVAFSPDGGLVASVAENGAITWAVAPPIGAQFSMIGRAHPEFFLFKDLPQDRAHHGGATLPRRVVLRRWDLFGR
jgi:WD40 repeat protein